MHSNIDLYKIQMYAAPEIKSPLLLLMLSLPVRLLPRPMGLLPRPMGLLLRPMVRHVITGSASLFSHRNNEWCIVKILTITRSLLCEA